MRNQRIAILILAAFLLLPYTTMVEGVETTEFIYEGSTVTEFSVELDNDNNLKDYFKVDFPADELTSVSLDISPRMYNNSYAKEIRINDSNFSSMEWGYQGMGYGSFGFQDEFNDGHTSQSLSLMNDEEEITIRLPANATDISASVDVSGRPSGSEDLEDGLETSVSSDQGSYSYYPDVAIDSSGNAHVVWVDNGDLTSSGDTTYDVFYNRWEGSEWSGIEQLTPTGTSISGIPYPNIVAEGSNIYVVWEGYRIVNSSYRYTVDFIYSEDGGDSWSKLMNVEGSSSSSPDYPSVAVDGSDIYVVWQDSGNHGGGQYTPNIVMRKSDDGGDSWGNVQVVSDDSRDQNSYWPRTYMAGSTLYVVWYDNGDFDGDETAEYDIVLRSTDDGGDTWSTTSLVSTSSEYAYYPQVAADTSDNVHVVWEERDSNEGNKIHYRKSTNGGTSWGDDTIISDTDTDYNPTYAAVAVDGTDVYVAWQQMDADDTTIYEIKLVYSSNGGSSFGTEQYIHKEGYSRIRERVQLYIDGSDNIWATWADEMQMRWHEGSGWLGNERDIWVRQSSRGATDWEDPLVASEHQYEAQSYQPILEVDEEGNFYMLYWDSGDIGGNGNSFHSAGDGDYFFTTSDDGGQTWSTPFVITDWEGDSTNYYWFYYKPDIAVGANGMVYVAWYEYDYNNTDGSRYKILLRISEDYGQTWGEITTLDYGTSAFYFPNLAVDGDNVYYSARKYDGTYWINFKYSTDQGDTWSSDENLYDFSSSSSAYEITMDADNGNVVVGWEYASYTYYRVSTDNGESFGDQEQIPADDYAYDPMVAMEGNSIYFTYRGYEEPSSTYISAMFIRSTDAGENWDEYVKVSNNTDRSIYSFPAIDCDDGLIYIAYYQVDPESGQYAVYLVFSDDHGVNWEPPVIISDELDDDTIYTSFPVGIAVGGQALFSWTYYQRQNNFSHYQIWSRVTKGTGYPEDPELSIQGSSKDWSFSGELNRDNSPDTWDDNFAGALEDGLAWALEDPDERTFVDRYGNQMANLTITGTSSDSEGRLLMHNLEIEYDVTFTVATQELLASFERDQRFAEDDGRDIAESKLIVMGTSEGGAFISNLKVITADVDLELEDLTVTGTREEGNDLELSVYISNKAISDVAARATVTFWKDESSSATYGLGNGIDSVDVDKEDLPNDGSTFEVTGTWDDIPHGNWYLFATITSSSPEDVIDPSDNQVYESVNVAQLFSNVAIEEITFDPAPIEGQRSIVNIVLSNDGDKSGYVDLEVYVDQTSGQDIHNESGIEVRVDDPEYVDFYWDATPAEKFIIVWTVDEEEQDDHEEDIQVMTLSYF